MGVVPVTSVVTVIRAGEAPAARVLLAGGWREIAPAELGEWVTERGNPENAKGVLGVEVFLAAPLLAAGMCLVDTPGIGSIFAGNTAATREFVPHVDAALVVVGADPPISADELALVEQLAAQVEDIILVLSKADRLPAAELEEARRFCAEAVTRRLGRPVASALAVSATERLAGAGAPRDWDQLVERLASLARDAGAGLVEAAERRGAAVVGARVVRELDERRGALTRPLAESEHRVEALRSCAAASEQALADLGVLLSHEERRLAEALRGRERAFVEAGLPEARRRLLGCDHELLEVHVVVRVEPPVEHVEHRHRQERCAVEGAQPRVEGTLVGRVGPGDRGADDLDHVADRHRDATSRVARAVAVAQLDGLARAGRGLSRLRRARPRGRHCRRPGGHRPRRSDSPGNRGFPWR